MKHLALPAILAVLVLTCTVAATAHAFGVKDVIAMHDRDIPEDLIIEKIQSSGAVFHLDTDDMDDLLDAGLSKRVLSAMLRTEADARDRAPNVYYQPYNHPSAYYDPWGYRPAPRVGFGVGFGWHSGPRTYGPRGGHPHGRHW